MNVLPKKNVNHLPEGPQFFLSTRARVRAWRAPEVQSSIDYRFFRYIRFLKCLQTLNRNPTTLQANNPNPKPTDNTTSEGCQETVRLARFTLLMGLIEGRLRENRGIFMGGFSLNSV